MLFRSTDADAHRHGRGILLVHDGPAAVVGADLGIAPLGHGDLHRAGDAGFRLNDMSIHTKYHYIYMGIILRESWVREMEIHGQGRGSTRS